MKVYGMYYYKLTFVGTNVYVRVVNAG